MKLGAPALAVLAITCGCGAVTDQPPDPDADPGAEPDAADDPVDGAVEDAALPTDAAPIDAVPIDAVPVPHVVFVSSTTSTGLIGGVAAADARCQSLAQSVGLGGQYKAILADATQSVFSRIRITGPVRNILGTTLAADSSAFFSATGLLPNNITERGEQLTQPTVAWIGASNVSCNNWTNETAAVNGGLTYVTANQWTRLTANTSCIAPGPRLQCISQ